jgi:hypothetical protein
MKTTPSSNLARSKMRPRALISLLNGWFILALLRILHSKQVTQESNSLTCRSGGYISCHCWEVVKESAAPYLQAHTQVVKEGQADSEESATLPVAPKERLFKL